MLTELIIFLLIFAAYSILLETLSRRAGYKRGYEKGDYDGFRRYHNNQICIDCKGDATCCGNPNGYDGTGFCKWRDD